MVIFCKKHLPVLMISVVLVALAVVATDTAYLTIEMTAQKNNYLQVFWAGEDGRFMEEKQYTQSTSKGRQTYTFALPNAMKIERLRVDLQQGYKERIPHPVEVHSIRCEFNWLFRCRQFASDFSDVAAVQGMIRNPGSDEVIFTDADPKGEYEMEVHPILYQMVLPVLILMSFHALLHGVLLRQKKNRYLLDIVLSGEGQQEVKRMVRALQGRKIRFSIVHLRLMVDGSRLRLQIDVPSPAVIYSLIREAIPAESVQSVHCIAARSGEIL